VIVPAMTSSPVAGHGSSPFNNAAAWFPVNPWHRDFSSI